MRRSSPGSASSIRWRRFIIAIYSPVIFIEFYHQPGVALPNTGYNRRHAHALVRTPNGNDYGRALLRQFEANEGAD